MATNNGLSRFLTAIQEIEARSYQSKGQTEGNVTPFGAYGMWEEAWPAWSQSAGLGGHSMFDPTAQDSVAAHMAQKLFQRYGSWDMVAAAWYSGVANTDRAASTGQGIAFFKNERTVKFLELFTEKVESEEYQAVRNENLSNPQQKWINPNGAPRGWLNPIAGSSEYSDSFRVPRDNQYGIHGAIDVYATKGTPIVAPVGGRITASKVNSGKGGNWITMLGDDGLTYYFAHMNGAPTVAAGQQIQPGTHVGFVGDSGSAAGTKPHLHFRIKRGNQLVNPYTYLQGSKNAGNYYAPGEEAQHQAPQERPPSSALDNVLSSVSDKIAGGTGIRADYRDLPYRQRAGDPPPESDTVVMTPPTMERFTPAGLRPDERVNLDSTKGRVSSRTPTGTRDRSTEKPVSRHVADDGRRRGGQ